MAYDTGLVARVDDALRALSERGIRQKGVFGGRGFLNGKTTFLIVIEDGVIVKVPAAEYQAVLAERGVTPFAPGGEKPMSTWVVVESECVADDPQLHEWIRRGLRGVR